LFLPEEVGGGTKSESVVVLLETPLKLFKLLPLHQDVHVRHISDSHCADFDVDCLHKQSNDVAESSTLAFTRSVSAPEKDLVQSLPSISPVAAQ
jgi:hypothetical protein